MLTVAQLFDSSQNGMVVGVYLDVGRSAIRILLTCISKEIKDVSQFDLVSQLVASTLASKKEGFIRTDVHYLSVMSLKSGRVAQHRHRCQVSRNVRDSPGSGAPVPCPARN